jgi:hypothetical protein
MVKSAGLACQGHQAVKNCSILCLHSCCHSLVYLYPIVLARRAYLPTYLRVLVYIAILAYYLPT